MAAAKRNDASLVPELSRVDLWHMHATVIVGNALQIAAQTNQIFNMQVRQNPYTTNDYWEQYCWLRAGSYKISVLYEKTANSGIVNLTVTDSYRQVYGTNLDTYVVGVAFNQFFNDTLTIERTGKHTVAGRTNTKNASSGGYDMFLSLITLMRTGD